MPHTHTLSISRTNAKPMMMMIPTLSLNLTGRARPSHPVQLPSPNPCAKSTLRERHAMRNLPQTQSDHHASSHPASTTLYTHTTMHKRIEGTLCHPSRSLPRNEKVWASATGPPGRTCLTAVWVKFNTGGHEATRALDSADAVST